MITDEIELRNLILQNRSFYNRAVRALNETEDWIEKESARPADTRPPEAQKILEKYIAHAEKLRRAILGALETMLGGKALSEEQAMTGNKPTRVGQVAHLKIGDLLVKREAGAQEFFIVGRVLSFTNNSRGRVAAVLDRVCWLSGANTLTQKAFNRFRMYRIKSESSNGRR